MTPAPWGERLYREYKQKARRAQRAETVTNIYVCDIFEYVFCFILNKWPQKAIGSKNASMGQMWAAPLNCTKLLQKHSFLRNACAKIRR